MTTTRDSAQVGLPAERRLDFARSAMNGDWLNGSLPDSSAFTFRGAAVDSRHVQAGQLFFALPGEQVNGFDFCTQAQVAGAVAVVVEASRGVPAGVTIPVLGVASPVDALADLARAVRRDFKGRVVGVTGSNGKTTTKELIAAALSANARVLRTQGNFNTEIGLPLTILSATGDEDFWVLEMAMRGRGQIALLADIAQPHVGVITNVAGAHLELLGSIEEVARAKGELFAGLGVNGIAILPVGDPLIEEQAAHLPESRKLRFAVDIASPHADSAVAVALLEATPAGAAGQVIRFRVAKQPVVARLPLSGIHNARNAGAALAVALAFDVAIPSAARALSDTVLPPHRSFPREVAGRIVIDDCYNANPASMRAALAMLVESATSPRAFAILGDMRELGPDASALHREIGREWGARLAGLGTVGVLARELAEGARAKDDASGGLPSTRIVSDDDPSRVAKEVASWTRPGDWILVKASRGMRLERAVDSLIENFATGRG